LVLGYRGDGLESEAVCGVDVHGGIHEGVLVDPVAQLWGKAQKWRVQLIGLGARSRSVL
jgi:hypothetical protein